MSVAPVLEATGLTVRYPGQLALDGVDLRLFPGEVHSLIGENGAGKSTLIKALTGAVIPDAGTLRLDGAEVSFGSPGAAAAAGIAVVYQELDLLPNLSVAENIMLGREPHRFGSIDWRRTREEAVAALAALDIFIDPASPLQQHPAAVQQLVAIARAVRTQPRVLILDEPTSSLDQSEVTELFRVIRTLKEAGVAIVFITHFLEQVYEVSDRLTVLRGGRLVGEYLTREILQAELVGKMLGRHVESLDEFELRQSEPDDRQPVFLEARGLGRDGVVAPFDLRVREGEVLGLAGLLGSGRTELARLISGVDRHGSGRLTVEGAELRPGAMRAAIARGVVYSAEDRRYGGIIEDLSIEDNILLALQAQRGWMRRASAARRRELAQSWIEALGIVPADPQLRAGALSGGNQQKVLLARWLAVAPRLLILDEPTRGIDIGAKVELQRLMLSLAQEGMAVVFISGELEELLRVSDRIGVMRERRLVGVLENDALSYEDVLALIARSSRGDDDE
ncbi:sugar ABC transporter ATP-binding protein [Gryllotalpicola daejeonensis]|uniref:Sugar ABC transporter ATP-binding protein n=1 Tax=Gryllotalpicola daejeonensis TaxID=993087 RepID=A0ABP7ZNY8_9MICO